MRCVHSRSQFTELLQVKTFVLHARHYDQEVLPEEVQMFFRALATKS